MEQPPSPRLHPLTSALRQLVLLHLCVDVKEPKLWSPWSIDHEIVLGVVAGGPRVMWARAFQRRVDSRAIRVSIC